MAALLVLVLHAAAFAEGPLPAAGPAPDVARGERFDGRPAQPRLKDDLLLIPRLVLAPFRLLWRGVAWPVERVSVWAERHQVARHLVQAFTSDDGLVGFRPSVSYTSSFAPLFGATFFDHRFIAPGTALELSLQGGDPAMLFTSMYLRPTHEQRGLEVDFDAAYNRRNDRLFSGIGMLDARTRPGSRYAIDEIDLRSHLRVVAAQTVRGRFGAGFGVRRFADGRILDPDLPITQVYCVRDARGACLPGTVDESQVPGFHAGTQFARLSAELRIDTRDSPFRPSSGAALHLSSEYSHGLGADRSSYFRFHGGLEAALDLWQRSRVLVARITTDLIVPTDERPVPFSELVVLGGPDDLRGARPGKYRDFSSLLFSLEYRWPIWMWMDGALFVDYGGAFGRGFAGIQAQPMVTSLGAGVRVRTLSRFYARLQLAYGFGEGLQTFFGASVEP